MAKIWRISLISTCLLLLIQTSRCVAQQIPAEKADHTRIDQLLKQMTIEEKVNLIRGDVEPANTNQAQAGYLHRAIFR